MRYEWENEENEFLRLYHIKFPTPENRLEPEPLYQRLFIVPGSRKIDSVISLPFDASVAVEISRKKRGSNLVLPSEDVELAFLCLLEIFPVSGVEEENPFSFELEVIRGNSQSLRRFLDEDLVNLFVSTYS